MADDRKIVIELKVTGNTSTPTPGSTNTATGTQTDEGGNIDLSALIHPIKTAEKVVLGKSVLLNQSYQIAKQSIKSTALYSIHKNFNLRENYLAEQDLNNTMTSISKTVSFGTTVGGAMMLGGGFTPVGIVAGVVAGLGYAINEGISQFQKIDQQNMQIANMNYQSSFQRTRLGLVGGTETEY